MSKLVFINSNNQHYIITNDQVYKLIYTKINKVKKLTIQPIGKYNKDEYEGYEVLGTFDYIHHIITDFLALNLYKRIDKTKYSLHFHIGHPMDIMNHLLFGPVESEVIIKKADKKSYLIEVFNNL